MTFKKDLIEWAENEVNESWLSGYYGINVIERILRDPGFSSGTKSRVLWWPKNRRLARISRAMHQIDPISAVCLIVRYGRIVQDDGRLFTSADLTRNSSLTKAEYSERIRDAEHKLRRLLG